MKIFATSTNYKMFMQYYMELNLFHITAEFTVTKSYMEINFWNDHSYSPLFSVQR